MGAMRGLTNQMFRRLEIVRAMPKFSIRRTMGEVRRDALGLFTHVWGDKKRSKGLRSFEARLEAEDLKKRYEHSYHPTKGWRVVRV